MCSIEGSWGQVPFNLVLALALVTLHLLLQCLRPLGSVSIDMMLVGILWALWQNKCRVAFHRWILEVVLPSS